SDPTVALLLAERPSSGAKTRLDLALGVAAEGGPDTPAMDTVSGASSPRGRTADADHSEESEGEFVHARRDAAGGTSAPQHAAGNGIANDGVGPQQPQPTTEERENAQDALLLRHFWRSFDTIIILSICSVFGIAFRMMSATWFRLELGSVFSEDSALGTNLPLNICSCFAMGLLCSGREAMGIIHSKVLGGSSPYGSGRGLLDVGRGAYRGMVDAGRAGINRARGYRPSREGVDSNPASQTAEEESNQSESTPGLHRRRGNGHATTTNASAVQITDPSPQSSPRAHDASIAGLLGLDDEYRITGSEEGEMREVQLQGLTRRILASPSLVLFPARKEDLDVMEHYDEAQSTFEIGGLDDDGSDVAGDIELSERSPSGEASGEASSETSRPSRSGQSSLNQQHCPESENDTSAMLRSNSFFEDQVEDIVNSVHAMRRIRLLEGWNQHTTADEMKHILLLGLRVGFCGALSTYSSLNASVIRLFKAGSIGEGLVGFALSIQLGIVSYNFGKHVAVYVFVWRRRREAKRDERRGYGLRLQGAEDSDDEQTNEEPATPPRRRYRRYIPSVRTAATFLFGAILIFLLLAIFLLPSHQAYLCSLLFTPFGCLARWRLMSKWNKRVPGFPIGTFSCNMLSVALSGSLGSFLAGNPGPEESIVLTSLIAGFAGSLSTFAAFIVETTTLIEPILLKFDGVVYAIITVVWGVIIGYLGSQAKNWADEI
ncbi:hypothetical protein ACHAXT_007566, partial [Thalassiosira profunda]